MVYQNVQVLIESLIKEYGDSYSTYGTFSNEQEGAGFRIAGISATFSVMCVSESAEEYDVQIESYPPGDYLFNTVVSLHELLVLIPTYKQAQVSWPR